MAITNYTVVEGEVVSQVTGGVRLDYVPDPLGSTVALLDSGQNFTDTWEYWPYGEVRARTGATSTPFQFVGTLGYFRDTSARTYVRARHYKQNVGRWMTVDLLWPEEDQYEYVSGNPVLFVDPLGKQRSGPAPVAPKWPDGSPRQGCFKCGVALLTAWLSKPQHGCNQQYVHCMTCCVLTRRYGPDCAIGLQITQNWCTPNHGEVMPDGRTIGKRRLDACMNGVVNAVSRTSCHDACIKDYPPKVGCTDKPIVPPKGACNDYVYGR